MIHRKIHKLLKGSCKTDLDETTHISWFAAHPRKVSLSLPHQYSFLNSKEVFFWSGRLHWSDTTLLWAHFTQICDIQTTWNHFPLLILTLFTPLNKHQMCHSSMSTWEPCKRLCSHLWKVMLPPQDDNSLSHRHRFQVFTCGLLCQPVNALFTHMDSK